MFIGTHVDDCLIFSTEAQYDWIRSHMAKRFQHTADGLVTNLLGMKLAKLKCGYKLSQKTYCENFLSRFGYLDCKPFNTPCDKGSLIIGSS